MAGVVYYTGQSISFSGCGHEKKSQSDEGVSNWFHAPPPS